MDKDSAIRTRKAHEAELRALGVQRLSLFGSPARGEAGPNSDVDLAVTLDPDAKIGWFAMWHCATNWRECAAGTSIWSESR